MKLTRVSLLAVTLTAVAASPAFASDSASDGTRTLTVSQASGLSDAGQTIMVSGSGYDVTKGIYVALCVATAKGVLPSPCGGGVDMEGDGGASIWISDNPPSYAKGLPLPYGPGGSFSVSFRVGPVIDKFNDCRAVRCAIVTKSDHTITSDRSQDLQIPVTFLGTAPTTTVKPSTTRSTSTTVASATTVDDGQTAQSEDETSTTLPESTTTTLEDIVEVTVVNNVDDLVLIATEGEQGRRWLMPLIFGVGAAAIVLIATIVVRRKR